MAHKLTRRFLLSLIPAALVAKFAPKYPIGTMFLDQTAGSGKYYNGSEWVVIASAYKQDGHLFYVYDLMNTFDPNLDAKGIEP